MNKSKHRVILHIDMDAFFASVEQRDNPKLRGIPVVIGSDPKGGKGRGIVSTCSYEARKFGIHSAQPISQAYRLCPHAHFMRGSSSKYSQASKQIRKILYDFTPDVQPISIDEAFMDITGTYHFYKTPAQTAQAIKDRIRKEVDLPCSIGIAPVKFVAKMASDEGKPDGLLEIKPGEVENFLKPLAVEKLWGVGPKSKAHLNRLGIYKIGDLFKFSLDQLIEDFGEHGEHIYNLSRGIDEREVEVDDEVKSVSHEHTFERDIDDLEEIYQTILHLSEKVSRRLRKYELKGKTLTVKIRLKGFKTYTRSFTYPQVTNLIDDIYRKSKELFDEFYEEGQMIRLIGVRISNFEDLYVQDSLFVDQTAKKSDQVQKAMDRIKDKFGEGAIHRGP